MRILSISLLLIASSASAQTPPSIDCNAIRNSTVPVELIYHTQDGAKTIVQTYRNKPGDHIIWSHQTPPHNRPNAPVIVIKGIYVDGIVTTGEISTPLAGKYARRTNQYTADGLPRNFDRRSDVAYKMHLVITNADNSVDRHNTVVSYTFKSAGTMTVGSCVLQVVRGEGDSTTDTAPTRHTFQLYFPELEISITATGAEPVIDSLSTVFSRIKPLNQ